MMEGFTMKLYLDNCCFNRPFDVQTQLKIQLETQAKLAVQNMIYNGVHSLVWSYMLEYENSQNPFLIRRESIIKWKDIADTHIFETENILKTAESLLSKELKVKDAIHIACVTEAKCDYFLTTDIGILKKNIDIIKVLNPIDFIRETEVELYD